MATAVPKIWVKKKSIDECNSDDDILHPPTHTTDIPYSECNGDDDILQTPTHTPGIPYKTLIGKSLHGGDDQTQRQIQRSSSSQIFSGWARQICKNQQTCWSSISKYNFYLYGLAWMINEWVTVPHHWGPLPSLHLLASPSPLLTFLTVFLHFWHLVLLPLFSKVTKVTLCVKILKWHGRRPRVGIELPGQPETDTDMY